MKSVTDAWIDQRLTKLARVAWAGSERANPSFVLASSRVTQPKDAESVSAVVGTYYAHARQWAPGFEVPFSIPKVTITALLESAGRYRVEDGYVHVDISRRFLNHPAASLAILAHEVCHHILDLSGIGTRIPEIDEPTTDLAMFICGFGEVFIQGHSSLLLTPEGWRDTHLGYLTLAQYHRCQEWVLNARGIVAPARPQAVARPVPQVVAPLDPPQRKPSWLLALIRRLMGRRADKPEPKKKIIVPSPRTPSTPRPGQDFRMPDRCEMLRSKLLNRLGGNKGALDRLLSKERGRNPDGNDLAHLQSIAEKLDRDRGR